MTPLTVRQPLHCHAARLGRCIDAHRSSVRHPAPCASVPPDPTQLPAKSAVEGEHVAIEYRWPQNQFDRLPALATELVRRPVAAIVPTGGPVPVLAAKSASRTAPLSFGDPEDPVRLGLVASLARPGGNAQDITFFSDELTAKRLGRLRELVPAATRVPVLVKRANIQAT